MRVARGSRRRIVLGLFAALACEAASEREVPSTVQGPSAMGRAPTEGDEQVAGGRATDPEASAPPQYASGRYVLRMGDVELEVDPAIGGRVTRFSLAGENVLTGPEVVAGADGSLPNMYGSTFWTSPQSAWGWPPEVEIDVEPYRAEVSGDVLALTSEAGATTGYSVRKRFWTDARSGQVAIEYTLENQRATLPAAPWEISRVPKEGIVFFPATTPVLSQSTLPSSDRDGVAWIDIALAPPTDSKLFQDGSEGWIAYVARDLAFIKTFVDTEGDQAAPGEAEIEVFVNGLYEYVEIEQQGRYALPAPNAAASWQVNWMLRRLPPGIDASVGSAELVAWVREVVAAAR